MLTLLIRVCYQQFIKLNSKLLFCILYSIKKTYFFMQMCRELEFTWCGDNLGCKSLLINKPDGPIKLNFTKYKQQ